MRRYRFLASAYWVRMAALTVVVACVCVALGYWQLTRHEQRVAEIELVAANTSADPVPLPELLPVPADGFDPDAEWRAATVTGRYVGDPVALPQRGVVGSPADHALGLLAVETSGGTWLLAVDRGSYPTDAFADPTAHLALPDGEVTVVVRLRPAEGISERGVRDGQVFAIAPQQVAEVAGGGDGSGGSATGELVAGAYGSLVSETPTTADPPTPIAVPDADYRSNLSYALQWWVFGLMALAAYVVMARRQRAAARVEGAPAEGAPAEGDRGEDVVNDGDAPVAVPVPVVPGGRRRRTDAEIEDAEIDGSTLERTDGARSGAADLGDRRGEQPRQPLGGRDQEPSRR